MYEAKNNMKNLSSYLAASLVIGFFAMPAKAHPDAEKLYANCIVCCMADRDNIGDTIEIRRNECTSTCSVVVREIVATWGKLRNVLTDALESGRQ